MTRFLNNLHQVGSKLVYNSPIFSIGQKRRVSFSVALLHKPDLIILDEPTVGVDPVLRERYLFMLVIII